MRRPFAVLLLTALAPAASALGAPAPLPDAPLDAAVPSAPPLPLPGLALDTPAARVAADPTLARVTADVTLDAPALGEPVRVAYLDKAPHAKPRDDALHARLATLAARRTEKAFAMPARTLPPADARPGAEPSPDAPAAGIAFAPPAAGPGPAAERAQPAFAAASPTGAWRATAALAACALLALLAPLALYHRLRGGRALEHATRGRVFDLLRERPGLTPAEAARALAVDPKTARYHLVRLTQEGLAVAEGRARTVRYFAAGAVAAHERPTFLAAADSRAALDAVLRAPGLTKTELAAAMGVARPTVNWHLRRLLAAGLVRCERDGRGVRVHPAGEILPKPLNSRPL